MSQFFSGHRGRHLGKTKMPFLLNLETREISEHHQAPEPFQWSSMIIDICLVQEGGLGPELTPRSLWALVRAHEVIVQSRDEAWDLEYWTRGADSLKMVPGPPSPIIFTLKEKPRIRGN